MNHQLISQTPASLRDFRPIIVDGKINCISTQMARVDVICSGFLCIALLELSSLFCFSFFWGHFPSETLENTEWRGNIFSQGGRASVKSFTGSNFVTHTGRPALKAISVICETVQIEFLCQWLNTDKHITTSILAFSRWLDCKTPGLQKRHEVWHLKREVTKVW